jgi:hypothetical protein
MKKKILILAAAVIGFCSFAYSENLTPEQAKRLSELEEKEKNAFVQSILTMTEEQILLAKRIQEGRQISILSFSERTIYYDPEDGHMWVFKNETERKFLWAGQVRK